MLLEREQQNGSSVSQSRSGSTRSTSNQHIMLRHNDRGGLILGEIRMFPRRVLLLAGGPINQESFTTMLEQGTKKKNKEEKDRCSRLRRDDGSCC
jgi:hypothetical protein